MENQLAIVISSSKVGWWDMQVELVVTEWFKVATKLDVYLCELQSSLTQLSELNSTVLVVTEDTIVRDQWINY